MHVEVSHTHINLENIVFYNMMTRLTNYGIGTEANPATAKHGMNYYHQRRLRKMRDRFAIDMWQFGVALYALTTGSFFL